VSVQFICGVDASLTDTGLSVFDKMGKCHHIGSVKATRDNDPEWKRIDDIIVHFFETLEPFFKLAPSGIVLIFEGYALSSRLGKSMTRAEITGILKHYCRAQDCEVIAVPPTVLKKETTGNGSASKDAMKARVYNRWGYWTENDNLADAYALGRLGLRHFVDGEEIKFARHSPVQKVKLKLRA
jgi:Holliday junction resolvasome RuvABC endonuclease subunit